MPDIAAQPVLAAPEFALTVGGNRYTSGWLLDTYAGFGTAHLGPKTPGGRLTQNWAGQWTGGGTAQYATAAGGKVEKLATGYTKHWRKGELATVTPATRTSSAGEART